MSKALLAVLPVAFALFACAPPRRDVVEIVKVQPVEIEKKPRWYEFRQDAGELWNHIFVRGRKYWHDPPKPVYGQMCAFKKRSSEDNKTAFLKAIKQPKPAPASLGLWDSWEERSKKFQERARAIVMEHYRRAGIMLEQERQRGRKEFEERARKMWEEWEKEHPPRPSLAKTTFIKLRELANKLDQTLNQK